MRRGGATWRLDGRVAVASAWDGAANGAVTTPAAEPLPDDVETLKAMLLAERQAYGAKVRDQALVIEQLKHQIAQLRHERFGLWQRAELSVRRPMRHRDSAVG